MNSLWFSGLLNSESKQFFLLALNSKLKTMKKLMLVAGVVVFLASCKKDWTCECKLNGTVTTSSTINDTKKNAVTKCDEGDASILGATQDCEIQ